MSNQTFKGYLFKNKNTKRFIIAATSLAIIQFGVFKYLYPYASYIHGDSFSYLDAAHANRSISTYLIGYSMFLRIFSVFTRSDLALVSFQYILNILSSLYLLFTFFYLYKIHPWAKSVLLFFVLFNPLYLYLGNLVSSDSIFLSLSLIWFTLLLWIIHKPSLKLIIWHAVVIYIAFTFRYNALIYILISLIAFILSPQIARRKFYGLAMAIVPIGLFIIYTGNLYKNLTGTWQYSPFAGWQWANNAMYTYRYVDSAKRIDVPAKYKALDNMIRQYFDSTRDTIKYPSEKIMASTVYMWTPSMPLFKYRDKMLGTKDSTWPTEFKKWATIGPFFKNYGQYIITTYPWHFIRYYIWPNANKYYAPPLEFLEKYNSDKDNVTPVAKNWFRYDSLKVTTRAKSKTARLLFFYPILSGIINLTLLFELIFFILLNGPKIAGPFRNGVYLGASVWLLNAAFTISASSAALRFQSFPIILATIYSILLLDWIARLSFPSKKSN